MALDSNGCTASPCQFGIENEHKVGAIGKEAFTWSARIVDIEGKDVGTDQVGELIVKGNGVMTAYYSNPGLTEETIQGGWLYTGDLAKRDGDGFIFLVDRKKDLVISGGENIYPAEIEQIIIQYPIFNKVQTIDSGYNHIFTGSVTPVGLTGSSFF